MATLSTIDSRPLTGLVAGKAYFETSTNKFIVWNGSQWIELHSDGTGAVPMSNDYSVNLDSSTTDHLVVSGLGTAGVSIGCVSLWVNTTTQIQAGSTAARGYFVGWSTGSSFNGFSHGFMATNDKIMTLYSGGNKSYWSVGAGSNLDAGWHNVVLNHNGAGYEFYVDGINASSHPLGGTVTVSNVTKLSGPGLDNFMIGKAAAGFSTGGLFDEVALWSDGLTASQISDIYNNGVPGDLLNMSPDGWWRMGDNDSATDGGTVTGIQDASGNGFHATTVANSQPTFSTVVPS